MLQLKRNKLTHILDFENKKYIPKHKKTDILPKRGRYPFSIVITITIQLAPSILLPCRLVPKEHLDRYDRNDHRLLSAYKSDDVS